MNFLDMWNKYKMWLAPFVALFMWLISMVCFVFGLSFRNPILVMGFDATLYIAFGLSISNTCIQLIGNGMKLEKDTDGVFFWIWIASYVLGISSNTNTLLQILGIDSKALEWAIALALGAMIEIAPEKMIVMWLRSLTQQSRKPVFQGDGKHQNKPNNNHQSPNFRPSYYKGDTFAKLAREVMKEQKPAPTPPIRPLYQEPTYLGMQEQKNSDH